MTYERLSSYLAVFIISLPLITSTFHSQHLVAGSGGCVIPPNNLIGWWPGNGTPDDFLGNHNGVLGAEAGFASGYVDKAFIFDGVDDFVSVMDSTSSTQLDGFDELTLSAWIYPNTQLWQDGPNFINAIVSKYNTTMADGASYYLLLLNGNLRIAVFQSVSPEIWAGSETALDIPVNEWSHVAGVWRGGTTFELYVNGVEVSSAPISAGSPGSSMTMAENDIPVNFGRVESFSGATSVPSAFYHGLIDETAIFNRGLSADEIETIYLAGQIGKCKSINFLPLIIQD